MTLLSPPFALGADGQKLSGKLLRLSLGAAFRSSSGVAAVSGCLAGPPNTMGELSLPNNATTRVQPFRAVIQSSLDAAAGQYLVPNDAVVDLANPAQNATQFRKALVVVRVDDSQVSGVASSPTTDRAVLEVLPGALAATAGAAALPAPAGSWLALGELLIPPTGQAVTLTPYNPRTTTRGGILPVVNDASTIAGHAGELPLFDGQYRDHPAEGLQRGVGGAWTPASHLGMALFFGVSNNTSGTVAANTWYAPSLGGVEVIDTHNGHTPSDNRYIVPAGQGGLWEVSGHVTYVGLGNPARFATSIHVNGALVPGYGHGAYIESVAGGSGTMFTGTKLLNLNAGDIVAVMGRGSTIWQAWTDAANAVTAAQLLCKRIR